MKTVRRTLEALVVLSALAVAVPRPATAADCSLTYSKCFLLGKRSAHSVDDIIRLKKECVGAYLHCVGKAVSAV